MASPSPLEQALWHSTCSSFPDLDLTTSDGGGAVVTNRISTFYNQQNEKQYQVETSGLTMEQARWIEQLFYSHDVRMATKRTDFSQGYNPLGMPIILITDCDCAISDADGELNTVKFTYQYQDRRTYLPTDYLSVDHDRIFTEQFDPSFQ